MAHRNCFEALDRTLKDILCFSSEFDHNKVFGGITVIVGGDFRQILPVIPKGRREEIVASAINKSVIWNHCEIFMVTETEFGWNYISCQLCKQKVKQQNNMFWCNTCNFESQFPMPR